MSLLRTSPPSSSTRLDRRDICVIVFGAALVGVALFELDSRVDQYQSYLALSGIVSLVLLIVTGRKCWSPARGLRLGSPVLWACLGVGAYAAVMPIVLALNGSGEFLGKDVTGALGRVSLLSVLASIGLLVGSATVPSRRIRADPIRVSADRYRDLAYPSLVIGIMGFTAWVVIGGIDLRALNALGGDASYGSYAQTASGTLIDYLVNFRLTIAAGAALLLLSGITGRSLFRVAVAVAILAMLTLQGLRFPIAVAAAAVGIGVVKDSVVALRRFTAFGIIALLALSIVAIARSTTSTTRIDTSPSLVASNVQGSFDLVRPMAAVVALDPPKLFGSSYSYLAVQVIPRQLWPSKPIPPTVKVLRTATDDASGFAIPLYGEMWLNFGEVGVLIGMGIVGKVVEVWDQRILRRGFVTPWETIAVPLVAVAMSRGLFVQAVYTYTFFVGPVAILCRRAKGCDRKASRL